MAWYHPAVDTNPFPSSMVFQAVFPAFEMSREFLGVRVIERLEPYVQSGGFKNVFGAVIGDGIYLAINQWRITNAGWGRHSVWWCFRGNLVKVDSLNRGSGKERKERRYWAIFDDFSVLDRRLGWYLSWYEMIICSTLFCWRWSANPCGAKRSWFCLSFLQPASYVLTMQRKYVVCNGCNRVSQLGHICLCNPRE